MFLKSLNIKGFKSFADPTVLELEPGVTVVVGPNGSGKSNVVDAIAWVLGAQAPSAVRSQKMDDVIFAGTATRPALGRAEVSLTIDNSTGMLEVESSEVTVSRILFRSGESEYSINGAPCRLLDVQELLSDAGVGRQQHVIVSQGQIDAVLNARPEDRRSIIEEAAGVLKFRKRKEKAERRLDATEANLMRVQDLLREVRRQLRPLERQADAARRHGDLVAELAALRIHLAGREIAGLRTRLETLAASRLDAERFESETKSRLAVLDTEVMGIESELSARGIADLGDRLVRVDTVRERARGLAAVLTERRRSIERDRGQLLDEGLIASLEADVAALRAELDQVGVEAEAFAPELEALDAEDAQLAHDRERLESDLPDDDRSAERAASAAAEVRGELRTVRASSDQIAEDLAGIQTRLATLGGEIGQIDAQLDEVRADLTTATESESRLVADAETARSARRGAEEALAEIDERCRAESAETARWRARAEALQQALDAAHTRAGAERLNDVDGVLGILLDLVEIDEGWNDAVEAALGEALSAVVVDGSDAARRAIETLVGSQTSGAVLAAGLNRPFPTPPRVGDPVRPHIRSGRPGVGALLDQLLGNAVRVEGRSEAIEAALAHPDAVVVTSAGDRFGGSGWRIGAASGAVTASALQEATDRAETAAMRLAEAEDRRRELQAELATAQRDEAHVLAQLDELDARLSASGDGLARLQSKRRESDAETQQLQARVAELTARLASEHRRVAELDALLPSLVAREESEVEAARSRGEARAALEARAAVLVSRRRDLDVRRAGLVERSQFLERRIAETEQRLEADHQARRDAAVRRERLERSLAVIDGHLATVTGHREAVEREHLALTEQRRRQTEAVRTLSSRLDDLRRERSESERSLEERREQGRRHEIEQAEATLKLETVIETLRRDLDVEPDAAVASPAPDVPEGVTLAARTRELERELRLMGPINPLALEEFNELQARHTFLEEQLQDVRSTRRELTRVVRAIDEEIQTVFSTAYADVSANFTRLFSTLFPGGTGALTLTEPSDLLNTGIEVEAKPSGKNIKKLSLLSGGERSLTALAFLFAVFRSRPSPFYVMDEVEAALDDVNLHRFLGLIAEFRSEAQLLIVSHQKRTMEAGDALLGVSMQPGGSSKVVTERIGASA